MATRNNSVASAQDAAQFKTSCMLHDCRVPAQVARCRTCKLDTGMVDLCKLSQHVKIGSWDGWSVYQDGRNVVSRFDPDAAAEADTLRQPEPKTCKGALPDFWTRRQINKLSMFRDNSKYIGYYNANYVFDQIAMHMRVEPWEYRCYMKDVARIDDDPDYIPQNRRIYVGNDNLIRESELDHFKDGGYAEDDDGQPQLITPYDAGLEPDHELDEKLQQQYGTPDMWRQQGVACHVVYQHSTHTNYVIAGSYTRQVKKVVYQPERHFVWYHPYAEDRPLMTVRIVRSEIEYREDNTVMQKQHLPTLHPIMIGQEKCVVASSTVRTKKDRRFLEVRKYENQVVERHRQLLIHRDEVESVKRVAIPA